MKYNILTSKRYTQCKKDHNKKEKYEVDTKIYIVLEISIFHIIIKLIHTINRCSMFKKITEIDIEKI